MDAKDFRTGNWVNEIRCDGELYPSQITQIQINENSNKIKCGGWFADSPIPLTEEWLTKKIGAKEVNSRSGVFKCFELHGIKLDMSRVGNNE